jgi:large subunit ribosomal protein L24
MELRKGTSVIVLSGKDKGKKGTVERVLRSTHQVVVGGVNLAKKHLKKSSKYPSGGIIEIAIPLHQSKVKIVTDEAPETTVKKPAKKKE